MKIAAICGAPNHNTGMMFVDRPLHLLMKNMGLLDSITFFCFQHDGFNKVGFNYSALTKDIDLNQFDCVLVWGDFIVSEHFLSMTQPKLLKRSNDFDYDLQSKVLMSHFSKADLKKVIVFGQCIFVDGRQIFSNKKYLADLKRLMEFSSLFKVRDPFSAYRAKAISDIDRNFLGVDAALLNYALEEDKFKQLKNNIGKASDKNEIGIYFGRSKQMTRKKKILGYYLKYKLKGLDFKWIPWLKNKQQSKEFFKFASEVSPETDIDYIKEILKCKLIITDTYHLTLMSWSLGVPCICFGNAAEDFKSTVHDKKKEIFFNSNYITDFYFYNEKFYRYLKNGTLSDKILNTISDDKIGSLVSDKIKRVSTKSLIEIKTQINSINNEN
jgi:polysaccharide pyruvyl transferase WcaK-like protein